MCTNPISIKCEPSPLELYKGIHSVRYLQVPCGKCAECLAKRQNDLSIKVYNEAKAKGSAVFVTLTYRDEDLPVASSIWTINRDTGEMFRFTQPEPLFDSDKLEIVRKRFHEIKHQPQFFDELLSWSEQLSQDFIVRYHPTLYYRDVQLALKRFRKNNPHLPEFSYVFVGEYGANPNATRRPHYHCIFFGLKLSHVYKFVSEWNYGNTVVKQVNFVNCDGSDGLYRVSKYVGKYCAKGNFDCYSKKDGCTLKSRMCSSKGLGSKFCDEQKRHFLALDKYEYNPEDLRSIPKSELDEICETIVSRLFFIFDNKPDFKYAIPTSFKQRIFGRRIVKDKADKPKQFCALCHGEILCKAVYYPIYYEVTDFIRNRFLQDTEKELERYKDKYFSKGLSYAVNKFEADRALALEYREKNKEANVLRFYQQHSKI